MNVIGPYTKAATHPNMKCIIFSGVMMAAYWFLPAKKNVFLLPLIFVFSYVAMGWYDQIYKCDRKLYTGSSPDLGTILDSIFKPQKLNKDELSKADLELLLPPEEQQKVYLRNVYLFHLVAVVPLLLYIGYNGNKSDPRSFGALLGIGILAGMYHSMRLINPRI